MKTIATLLTIACSSIYLAPDIARASLVGGGISTSTGTSDASAVYEKVELFRKRVFFTETFSVSDEGSYEAILTDFEFPKPIKKMAMHITTATDSIGMLTEAGSLMFDAGPGDYYVSFLAIAGSGRDRSQSNDRRHRDNNKSDRAKRVNEWSEERTEKARQRRALKLAERAERKRFLNSFDNGHHYGHMKLGQYGIHISQSSGVIAAPIPGAAWLFGSGLAGLLGYSRLRKKIS